MQLVPGQLLSHLVALLLRQVQLLLQVVLPFDRVLEILEQLILNVAFNGAGSAQDRPSPATLESAKL